MDGCPTCDAGDPCVLHDPLFADLRDPPGIPAGGPPPPRFQPSSSTGRRRRRQRSRPRPPLEQRVEQLVDAVHDLAAEMGLAVRPVG